MVRQRGVLPGRRRDCFFLLKNVGFLVGGDFDGGDFVGGDKLHIGVVLFNEGVGFVDFGAAAI